MTPDQMRNARRALGIAHRGEGYTQAEFGRLLRLQSAKPGQAIREYEAGRTPISGPLSLAVDLLLSREGLYVED